MKYSVFSLSLLFLLFGVETAVRAQQSEIVKSEKVYGRPFVVPSVRVYLTDEETAAPFAERDAAAKYCWGWKAIKRTSETDRTASHPVYEREDPNRCVGDSFAAIAFYDAVATRRASRKRAFGAAVLVCGNYC